MVDKSRFAIPAKPVHPLHWNCAECFHVVKDSTPNSKRMKCARFPPVPQYHAMGGGHAVIAISPFVNADEWCGEFTNFPRVAGLDTGEMPARVPDINTLK